MKFLGVDYGKRCEIGEKFIKIDSSRVLASIPVINSQESPLLQ
jgi:hypothetical protein